MTFHYALVGNPNSGKTTLFNELTGSSQHVGNWPGVTVEKKEGQLKINKDIIIQDLPGIYSLSPYTLEEVVARDYLLSGEPDAIINIIDASNLERNLYLTTQLMSLNKPMIIVLNMMDVVAKNGDEMNVEKLAEKLGVQIIPMSAVKAKGAKELMNALVALSENPKTGDCEFFFDKKIEKTIRDIQTLTNFGRFEAEKCFERDEMIFHQLSDDKKNQIEEIIILCEEAEDDDAKSLMTQQRYLLVSQWVEGVLKKNSQRRMTLSDKIDRIVTNRYLALPIFVAVMTLVYYISITTIGTMMTD